MTKILLDFPIKATPERVFAGVSHPRDLDQWWTLSSAGEPELGTEYALGFGPGYDWRAEVTRAEPDTVFELRLVHADDDWKDTRVGFQLEERDDATWVRFHHTGWPSANEHYRTSCCCWALYLRILRRYIEHGESVPYAERLDV